MTQADGGLPGAAYLGRSLASGDFDADGFADLALGSSEDFGRFTIRGSVTVLYGTAGGLTNSGAAQFVGPPGPGARNILGTRFGARMAAGDLDGDGFDDRAVAAIGESAGRGGSGAVRVLFGGPDGVTRQR